MGREKKQEYALFAAWGASFIATLGSLYFSEIMKFEPCVLCWYQRIFMYPFVLWLGIAVVKKDYRIASYSLPIASIGACISLYHYAIQKIEVPDASSPVMMAFRSESTTDRCDAPSTTAASTTSSFPGD